MHQSLRQNLRRSWQSSGWLSSPGLFSVTVVATAVLALSLGGCDSGGESTTAQSPITPAPDAVPTPGTSPTGQSPNGQGFPQPTVSPQTNLPKGVLPPDLISSTDPNQRVRVVQSNRPDPFALVPTTPSVQIPPPPPVATAAPAPAPRQAAEQNRTTATRSAGQRGSTGQTTANQGSSAPNSNRTPAAPIAVLPPQPTLARAVRVTGVVQVGDTLYAIVNAPNEPSSRYVQAGQSLSNGQIRVRRIDATGAEPKVVLEQFGIEVVTAVGEGGVPAPNASPAAAVSTTASQG